MPDSDESKQVALFLADADLEVLMYETQSELQKVDLSLSERPSTQQVLEKLELLEPLMKELVLRFAERIKHDHVSNLASVLAVYQDFVKFVYDTYKDQAVQVAGFYPAALLQYACTSNSIAHNKFYFASEILKCPVDESESGFLFNIYRIGDSEYVPHALRGTLANWLNNLIPSEANVYSLIDATEMMYSMILIGRAWRSSTRPQLENSSDWLPWQALLPYENIRELEKLIACHSSDVSVFDLDSLVGGTHEAKGYYSVCEILFKRMKRYRSFWESKGRPTIG
jgi:hypothetical protein